MKNPILLIKTKKSPSVAGAWQALPEKKRKKELGGKVVTKSNFLGNKIRKN